MPLNGMGRIRMIAVLVVGWPSPGLCTECSGLLQVAADTNTSIPDRSGTFTEAPGEGVFMDGGVIAFSGRGDGSPLTDKRAPYTPWVGGTRFRILVTADRAHPSMPISGFARPAPR